MEPSSNFKMNVRRKCYIPGAMFGPFSFINVSSAKEVLEAEDHGMKNMVEIAVIFQIMQLLRKESASSKHKISMAVLSQHPAQVKCMQQKLENLQQNNEFFNVRVGYVHDYQHGEADVVIISTVGADEDECSEVKTISNYTNVYPTWARHCLWILGDERMHMKGGSIWKSLILEAKAHKCFFQADESKELAKAICEVKKDLHQLDELLSGESTLFQNTTWKVLFSSMFRTSFSKIESLETKKLVFLMLLKLSSGWRPKGSSTAASVSKSSYFELIKEFKVKGLHLICTIDVMKETHVHYTQILKVWDILPFHEIAGLVTRLEGIFGMYTREYIDRCKEKCVQRGSEYREFPIKWLTTSEIVQYKTDANHCDEMFMDGANGSGCIENVKVRESLILMKFYSLSTRAVNAVIYGCDGGDLGIPFELTEQEKDVVTFDKSSFILGRSGTGKTTVLTMKLFQNEQLHHLAREGFHEVMEGMEEAKPDVLHQLFVTFSSKLCYAVRQQFGEWKRLTCGGDSSSQKDLTRLDDIDEMMLSEDLPDQFVNLPQDVYPLIITFHRFLLMLDGTVGTSYFERFPSIRRLIYGNKTSTERLKVLEQFLRLKEVTYKRFCSAYWPHFNNKLTKKLDPSTVYTEIMSVIKGGLVTDKAPNGILCSDDYVALCHGRISIFDAQKREIIYSIFLQYEIKKVENGDFDLADFVNDLQERLEVEGYKGDIMDYVYVDEVQDLSMRQIMLFKYVCTNVHEGFAFSGDTAQAIAKGIAFRFEDIRCMFFKKFLLGSERGSISKIFQLSENFRTHAGVLNLAQSVIDLLCHFFPLFVDALSPETSRISGDLPILLETDENNNAIKFIFESNGCCSQLITGFGAEQVVLVRDESLKEKVVNIVGKNALVLTIMESKGLEFQDVLLYDFFTTSSFSNEWRIIYKYMKDMDLLDSPFTTLCSSFDMQKHAVLCTELKQLYVAITRARQRLWICESTGFSEPIYDYWKKLGLVEVKHLSGSFADEMRIPSTKSEWRSRGVKLFHENNFRMAQMCFLKAGDEHSEKLAEAYHLRATGRNAWASQLEKQKLLNDAANLFSSIGKKVVAAECFYEIEDYKKAGYIYKGESMFAKAGNCFHLARCYKLAVEEYEKAGAFSECLSACTDGKLFDIGFERLGRWGECGGEELKSFLHKGAHYYFLMKDFVNMMKFVRSFSEKDDMRSFLGERRRFDELILLETEWGNFKEAEKVRHKGARYYFSIKDFERMIKFVRSCYDMDKMRNFLIENRCLDELILLEKEWGNFVETAKVARLHKESSLVILWHVFSNSPIFQNVKKPFTQKDGLLKLARSIAKEDSEAFYRFVCKEAEILSRGKTTEELLEKGLEFIYCYKENILDVSLEWVKEAHEIKKIEKNVIDRMRSYLKSVNNLIKLLLLDEICGEFVEAANIGNEDGHSLEATLNRLWYVFLGSLWARGRRAWPLKDFNHKAKLLEDAKSYMLDHPDSHDSAWVHTEIHVLSGEKINLSVMWSYLSETSKERSLRIHFLISRRILAAHLTQMEDEFIKHLEESLSENVVSVEGLIYFWNYWKEMICELINWSYTGGQGSETSKMYEDFVFNYFGLRKYDEDKYGGYVVLNVEAQWVKQTRASLIRKGYLYIILRDQFSSVASRYWCSELLFVAEKVCGKFQSLHAYSTQQNIPIHQQTKILMRLFEVVKSLQKCKLSYSRDLGLIVDKYLQLCMDQFFLNVVNINWKHAQSKEMICMRRNGMFRNMLKEAISINRTPMKSLTCGFNADTERKLRCSSLNWRDLFRNLMSGDRSASNNEDQAISLHNILKETFSAGWERVYDCISPACFLYLMDRLLILTFCFRGYVFTTRSAFVEWHSYDECGMGSNGDCATSLETMNSIHDSVTSMVSEMLNAEDELLEWLRGSNEPESLYSVLVLRLIVLLSLFCANSGLHYHHLSHHLGRDCYFSSLPSEFHEGLINGIKEDRLVDALAVACKKIDNPLVIVSSKEDFPKDVCQNAISLNMKKLEFGQESLIELLYLEKCKDADDHEAEESDVSPLSN